MAQARIIHRMQTPRLLGEGKVQVRTQITYQVGIQPPRTLYLDKPAPSDAEIADAIRVDQERARVETHPVIDF